MVAGTAALAIAGTSLAYAQQRGGRDGMTQGRQLNAEDLRAFGEARLAALKAGLVLTPEQEKNWPAFEQAARDLAKGRMDRISAMRNAPANAVYSPPPCGEGSGVVLTGYMGNSSNRRHG